MPEQLSWLYHAWRAYRLRWKRRYFLARAIRRKRQLHPVKNRTDTIQPHDIICFSTVRNELERIGHFLEHHRALGVAHFLIVDNGSSDGTTEFLTSQSDVSVWTASTSYKAARFGVDWLTYLQFRYGHGHWCLTLDADELFLPPYAQNGALVPLINWLDAVGAPSLGATMLDLYPKGPVGLADHQPGQDPLRILRWFDRKGLSVEPRAEFQSDLVRGGVRGRVFFSEKPDRAPTLNKVPLVKWNRRFAYLTSTHLILPPRLNRVKSIGAKQLPSAVLLHTKFLPSIVQKSADEKLRKEHFANSDLYDAYYDALSSSPDLWCAESVEFQDWRQLVDLGLMKTGDLPDQYRS
jgi:hypothetical protein